MPNRIIKESICESEALSECSLFACDLYKRLITYADDYGRLKVNLHGKLREFVNDEIKIRGNIECDYIESEPDYDVWKLS